ncbi:hypothetical protein BH11ARM2_BH11ARM2_38010 [soil metagenome]
MSARNRNDIQAAARFIDGANPRMDRKAITQLNASPQAPRITLSSVQRQGDFVAATFTLRSNGPMNKVYSDKLGVVHRADGWKLVTGTATGPDHLLGQLTDVLKNGMTSRPAVASKMTRSLSNLKQIALATLMLIQDEKDVYKLTARDAKKRVMPYIKNEKIFTDPGAGRSDVYAFNGALAGKTFNSLEAPAETVVWSLGPKGKLLFPYEGRTVVAFADGHVKILSREKAAMLRWEP